MTADTETATGAGEARRDNAGEVRFIPLSQIHMLRSHRRPDKKKVLALADSVEEIGLKEPIWLVEHERGEGDTRTLYDLVAGAHRCAVYRHLGRTEIPAIIMREENPLRIELWGIDENLMRSELSPGEESQALARRKKIYLQLHPETKVGHAQAAGMHRKRKGNVGVRRTPTFTEDTAKKTGKSASRIEKRTRTGERCPDDVFDMLNNTRFDKPGEWKALERLTPDQMCHVAKIARASDTGTLRKIVDREYPHKRKASPAAAVEHKAPVAASERMPPVTAIERIPGPTGPFTKGAGEIPGEAALAALERARPRGLFAPGTAEATAPTEPIGPAQARASLEEDVRAEVAAGNGLSALCTAWLGAPVLDRITFLRGLGLTGSSAEQLSERPISIGGEPVLAIIGVAEQKKPATTAAPGADTEPSNGNCDER